MEKGQEFSSKESPVTDPLPTKSDVSGYQACHEPPPPPPKDYLLKAILSVIFCFWPLGLFAVYKAIEARRQYQDGLYESAEKSSKEAGFFARITCITGCLVHALTWGIMLFTYAIIGITIGALFAAGVFNNGTKTD